MVLFGFLGFGWHIPCLWKTRRKSRRHILTNKTVISVLPSLFIIRQEPVIGRSAFELFAICTEHQIIDLIRSTGHLSGIFFPIQVLIILIRKADCAPVPIRISFL